MKKFFTLLLTMSLMFILAACGGDKEEQPKDSDATGDSKTDQVIDVQHELDDKAVQVPVNPEKVVVFDLGALDTMDELGLGDKIVGLPQATVP
ncbi:MAG TPA: ABC transporter, partial [Savagea sp.]